MKIFNDIKPLNLPLSVKAMNTPTVRGLINKLAASGTVYLEVGSYQGASLISAAHNNPKTLCIGIDNFSYFDQAGQNEKILTSAIRPYKNIVFKRGDYRDVLPLLATSGMKVDTYFYDGHHTYDEQLNGLELARPLLRDGAKIIVDDTNWEAVWKANEEFCRRHKFKVVFEKRTNDRNDPLWWNGVQVLMKDCKTC